MRFLLLACLVPVWPVEVGRSCVSGGVASVEDAGVEAMTGALVW